MIIRRPKEATAFAAVVAIVVTVCFITTTTTTTTTITTIGFGFGVDAYTLQRTTNMDLPHNRHRHRHRRGRLCPRKGFRTAPTMQLSVSTTKATSTSTSSFVDTDDAPRDKVFDDEDDEEEDEDEEECEMEVFGETEVGETCALPFDDEIDANNINNKRNKNKNKNNNAFYVIDDSMSKNPARTQTKNQQLKLILLGIPVVAPLLAFTSYVQFARFFAFFIDLIDFDGKDYLGNILQDGGLYQIQIITPAINGIVVPSISILFATLISNTVTALRQRQLDVRTKINTEASELRVLSSFVDSYPPSFERNKCRAYLMQYTSRLIAESRSDVVLNSLEYTGSMESEMNGFLATLNDLSSMPPAGAAIAVAVAPGVAVAPVAVPVTVSANAANVNVNVNVNSTTDDFGCEQESAPVASTSASTSCIPPPTPLPASTPCIPPLTLPTSTNSPRPAELLLSESYAAVMRLNAERSTRISALQSTFPLSQYLILVAIGSSICLAFLIETNQEILIFLNAFQLRILWTMLIGLMSTLSVLCYDLSDPFRGIFTIESALKQLYIIRDALRVSANYEDDPF